VKCVRALPCAQGVAPWVASTMLLLLMLLLMQQTRSFSPPFVFAGLPSGRERERKVFVKREKSPRQLYFTQDFFLPPRDEQRAG
jgi:hypothetical protein